MSIRNTQDDIVKDRIFKALKDACEMGWSLGRLRREIPHIWLELKKQEFDEVKKAVQEGW